MFFIICVYVVLILYNSLTPCLLQSYKYSKFLHDSCAFRTALHAYICGGNHLHNAELNWSADDCDGRATCSWRSRLTALLLGRLLGVLLARWGVSFMHTAVGVTTCIMRSSWCYWSADGCDVRATCSWSRLTSLLLGRRLVVEVGWRRCCLEDCWECCSSLRLARWGVLFRELIWLVPTKVFADLLLSLVTLRLAERATRTALLDCNLVTGPSRLLTDWSVFPDISVDVLWRTQV
jgi:hypothetical protein